MGSGSSKNREKKYIKEVDMVWTRVKKTCDSSGNMNGQELSIKRSGWKTIRIFVSSTFKDFHQEREVLVKEVFPDLRAWCEKKKLHLIECDLRWGIPQDTASEEVMRTCLGEIDRCFQDNVFPYFVNMTSERMGWIPTEKEISQSFLQEYQWVKGLSITEMEIIHAAYRKDNPNSIFMLREAEFIESVPYEYRHYFIDGNPIAPFKLKKLKDEIHSRFPEEQVKVYHCEFDGIDKATNTVKLRGLEHFKREIFQFFKERIRAQYPVDAFVSDSYIQAREQHEAFVNNRGRIFLGRTALITKVLSYATGKSGVPMLVQGEAGIGKSSLMARVASSIQDLIKSGKLEFKDGKTRSHWSLFYHFVGCCPESTDYGAFLERLLNHLDPDTTEKKDTETLAQTVHGLLNYPHVKPTIIVVDAANQFDDSNMSVFGWLPSTLQSRIRCIFSAIPGTSAANNLLNRSPPPQTAIVAPLDVDSRKEIVTTILGEYNKRLSEEQLDMLLGKKGSENPLWLSLASEELRVFGVFRHLSEKINHMADGLLDLEIQQLERFENEGEGDLIVGTLCLLECAARGLLETELRDILGDRENLIPEQLMIRTNPEGDIALTEETEELNVMRSGEPLNAFKWAVVFRHLKPLMRPFGSSGEGRLDFYHRSFSKAVRKISPYMYFYEGIEGGESSVGATLYRFWHGKLAEYFRNCTNNERRAEEYPYHLARAGLKVELSESLCDWDIFDQLYNEEFSPELLKYWRNVSQDFAEMGNAYKRKVEEMREDEDIAPEDLVSRYFSIINLLLQGACHQTANELLEAVRQIEEEQMGGRPDIMVEIFWLIGKAMDEILALENYMYRSQLPRMKIIIDSFEKSIKLRREMTGNYHKVRLARAMNRAAFFYAGWNMRGGDNELTADDSRVLAIKYSEEAIEIYRSLDDDTGMADGFITRGVSCGNASKEQIKFYKEAEAILLRTKGESYYNLSRLYLNEAIYYEESGNYYQAFDYFNKWYNLNKELYGPQHAYTKRTINTLREPIYRRIALEKGIEPPSINEE